MANLQKVVVCSWPHIQAQGRTRVQPRRATHNPLSVGSIPTRPILGGQGSGVDPSVVLGPPSLVRSPACGCASMARSALDPWCPAAEPGATRGQRRSASARRQASHVSSSTSRNKDGQASSYQKTSLRRAVSRSFRSRRNVKRRNVQGSESPRLEKGLA